MEKLGYHWVFEGFRIFLTDDQITYFVVHLGGFLLDLTVGFFMLMDFSRAYAFLFCAMFNLMNSRMFSIGMFPYVMIAVMPIFCSVDWPQKFLNKIPIFKTTYSTEPSVSSDCIYSVKQENKSTEKSVRNSMYIKTPQVTNSVQLRHKMTAVAFCFYFVFQFFMPYSHWLTKGYNTWTQGLYGYSWDMMVHNWRFVHSTVTILDKNSGKLHHIDPEMYTRSHRWTHHADMVKQFAHCVEEKMDEQHGMKDVEVYIDVWMSLNRRFIQRMYDPSVDILAAQWSPFKEVTWVLPLQTELTKWRGSLVEMEEKIFNQSENIDVLFVADFPGFHLLNYVNEKFDNTTIEVLKGRVEIQLETEQAFELREGQSILIPSGQYHRVSPLKYSPACYKYQYLVNKTDLTSVNNKQDNYFQEGTCPLAANDEWSNQVQFNEKATPCRGTCWHSFKKEALKKFEIWKRSMLMIGRALCSILTQSPMTIEKENLPSEKM